MIKSQEMWRNRKFNVNYKVIGRYLLNRPVYNFYKFRRCLIKSVVYYRIETTIRVKL